MENDVESLNNDRIDEELEAEENVLPPYEEYRKYKVRYFLCVFLLCPLLLTPFIFVFVKYGTIAFQYKLVEAVQQKAWKTVLARASLTACITLLAWTGITTISVLIPYTQLRYRKKCTTSTVRSLTALLQTRAFCSRALFLLSLLFIFAKNLYDTTLLQNALEVVSKRFAASSDATTQNVQIPLIPDTATFVFYLERVHICAVIFAFVFFLFEFLLHLILYSFHVTTFGKRIQMANQDTQVLADLYKSVSKEETRFLYGLQDQLNLSSEHRAATIAKALFESMAEGKESISSKDLSAPAKKLLSQSETEELTLDDFVQSVTNLHNERMNIRKSLKSNRHIMHKLDRMFSTVAFVLSALLSTPFLDIGVTTLWAGFLALFTALGFALQSVGKTSFEAMLFIFVVHSFDIGDVIVIDGQTYHVEHLEVFTSEFRKVEDDSIVYAPNSALSSKNIINISRTKRDKKLLATK